MDISKATPELFAALAAAQGELENASKNAANPHFRSKYADLAEVLNTVRPVLSRHGISVLQDTGYDGSVVYVNTVIGHASGGAISSVASCVPAKSDAQGIGSATTYLRRYSLAAMAGVAQEDDDGNAAAHNGKPAPKSEPPQAITVEQADEIKDLLRTTKSDTADFLKWLGAGDAVDTIPSTHYKRAVNALLAKAKKEKEHA